MKTLYMIGGTMGVGKTAVCQQLKLDLPNSVFLDGDWCWDASPFQVTDETKAMVTDNICYLLNSFLRCSAYENIIFCWVMHEQSIIDSILEKLDAQNCEVKCVSLVADEKTLRERLSIDVERGIRSEDVIERSMARIPMYQALHTMKVDTNGKTVAMIAHAIKQLSYLSDSHLLK
ncbi:MAG: AAA family ATPase [Clostridia bacterium]|nr:AAA family ATPase [Clostridia bacterium]